MTRGEWRKAQVEAARGEPRAAPIDKGVRRMLVLRNVLRGGGYEQRWALVWCMRGKRRRVNWLWPLGPMEWAKRRG